MMLPFIGPSGIGSSMKRIGQLVVLAGEALAGGEAADHVPLPLGDLVGLLVVEVPPGDGVQRLDRRSR